MDNNIIKTIEGWILKHEKEIKDLIKSNENILKRLMNDRIEIIKKNEEVIQYLSIINRDISNNIKKEVDNSFKNFETQLSITIQNVKKEFEKDDEDNFSVSNIKDELNELEEYNKNLINKKIKTINKKIFISMLLNFITTLSTIYFFNNFLS